MKTVTSVSGGKTSCYMALHYPTDYYVFAAVLTDHQESAPKDKGLLRECQDRIPHFIASHEADLTLANVLRLEQELGKEIKWVAAEYSLDRFIEKTTDLPGYRSGKAMLPNARQRFCTIEQKLKPIFWHCYLNYWDGDPFLMNIGFRWDEPQRVEDWNCANDRMHVATSCPIGGGNWKYQKLEWRAVDFPLYRDRILKPTIVEFWQKKGWEFPIISNCRQCFHHRDDEKRYQARAEPENTKWWIEMEEQVGSTFDRQSLKYILSQATLDDLLKEESERASCMCSD